MECDGKLPFVEVPKRKTMILPLSYFKASQLSVKNLEIIGDNRTVEGQVFFKGLAIGDHVKANSQKR